MMSNQERKNLYRLLSSLVDESIAQDGINELEGILDGNSEAQKIYLHFIGLHQDLQNNNKTPSLKSNKTDIATLATSANNFDPDGYDHANDAENRSYCSGSKYIGFRGAGLEGKGCVLLT